MSDGHYQAPAAYYNGGFLSDSLRWKNVFNLERYANLAAAVAAVPSEGGMVYIPAGVHVIDTQVVMKDNVHILGGPGSILQQSATGPTVMFDCNSLTGVTFEGVSFEFKNANFDTVLDLDGSTNCKIINCQFKLRDDDPSVDDTYMAILSRGSTGLLVQGNYAKNCQFKLGSGQSGTYDCRVIGNYFEDPYNFAISSVDDQGPSGTHGTQDMVIANNIVKGVPSGGAFFIGADGESSTSVYLRNLVIADNIIHGVWEEGAVGIIIDSATTESKHISITGNVVRNDQGGSLNGSVGIRYNQATGTGVYNTEHLLIANNTVEYVDHGGIQVLANVNDLRIIGNSCTDTRGIRLYNAPNVDVASTDIIIANNFCEGKNQGMLIDLSAAGTYNNVLIHDNIFKNTKSGSNLAGIRLTGTAGATLDNCRIHDNICYDDQGIKTQEYGLQVDGAATFNTVVYNNEFEGNATGRVSGAYETMVLDENTAETYTPSNVTTTRTFDADTAGNAAARIDTLADTLGTLIADLQAIGLIK